MTKFEVRLRAAMKDAGMSQSDLSRITGIRKNSISQYANGKHTPTSKRAYQIADALGIDADYLLGKDPPPPEPEYPESYVRTPEKVTVQQAAECVGVSPTFLRVAMRNGSCPFGWGMLGDTGRIKSHINPDKLRECVGETRFTAYFGRAAP